MQVEYKTTITVTPQKTMTEFIELNPLLNVFPADIVHMVNMINYYGEKADIISRCYRTILKNRIILKNSLEHLVYHDSYDSQTGSRKCIISHENIENLIYILSNYYSKSKYDMQFWENYLSLFAHKLWIIWTHISVCGHDQNKNKYYMNFKRVVQLWLCLCKKYNINLILFIKKSLTKTDFNTEYINSRQLIRLKNFNKFTCEPRVYFEVDNRYKYWIKNNEAYMYLHRRLLMFN